MRGAAYEQDQLGSCCPSRLRRHYRCREGRERTCSPSDFARARSFGPTLSRSIEFRVIVSDLATNDLSIEREGLQDYVEAAAGFVGSREPEVEPEVVLALASDHGIGPVRRSFRLISILRHPVSPFERFRCPARAGGEARTAPRPAHGRSAEGMFGELSIAYASISEGQAGHPLFEDAAKGRIPIVRRGRAMATMRADIRFCEASRPISIRCGRSPLTAGWSFPRSIAKATIRLGSNS